MTKLTGVTIAIPAYGHQICMETCDSLLQLVQFFCLNKLPYQIVYMGAADLEAVRNVFLTMWYDGTPNFSHLLFIDTDMKFEPTMVRNMIAFDKPVVGAYYAKRQYPLEAVGQSFKEEEVCDVQNGFLKVKGVGAGVLLIRRDAIDEMLEKFPGIADTREKAIASHLYGEAIKQYGGKRIIKAFDRIVDEEGFKLSEDMSFCKLWRDCGGDVWAEVDHRIGHIGRMNFECRYADYLENKAKDEKAKAA